jgi:hypothetical protein
MAELGPDVPVDGSRTQAAPGLVAGYPMTLLIKPP